MEKREEKTEEPNWSETVEDLVAAGDAEAAITFLETLISKLETRLRSSSETVVGLQLVSALTELANLYSSKGFSLKSDELRSRAALFQQRQLQFSSSSDAGAVKKGSWEDQVLPQNASLSSHAALTDGHLEISTKAPDGYLSQNGSSDDDWEALADREPNELISSHCLPGISKLSFEDTEVEGPKQRGRGTFSYKKNELYSDRQLDNSVSEDAENQDQSPKSERNRESNNSKYGLRHVLVLADFSPSTRTIELEKLFEDFNDRGVVIRWVNDTTALAVFRTPSIALEALNHVRCPFTVRILDENDVLSSSISTRDLEPPRQRPQTSARTAQRLIAQGMGLKLPSSTFGSKELKSQEVARRNRIVTRQKLKDDAWGAD